MNDLRIMNKLQYITNYTMHCRYIILYMCNAEQKHRLLMIIIIIILIVIVVLLLMLYKTYKKLPQNELHIQGVTKFSTAIILSRLFEE